MHIPYSTAIILFTSYCFATCVFAKYMQNRLGENKQRQLEKTFKALMIMNGLAALILTCIYWPDLRIERNIKGMPWFFFSVLAASLYVIHLYDGNHYRKSMEELLKNRWWAEKDKPRE